MMHKLVFLPGASGSQQFWQPLMARLPASARKTVIAYPGFDGVEADASIQRLADLKTRVISQIEEDSILIAQSMGGVLAIAAALQQPNRLRALVLMATSGGLDLTPFQAKDWREIEPLQWAQLPQWFVEDQSYYHPEQLASIDLPVLLLWADQDELSPVAVGEFLAQQLPNARLVIMPDADHWFASSQAERVAGEINRFLHDYFCKATF